MVYTSLTQVSSPNLHHTSFTCQSGYTQSALGELCNDDIMAVAQRPLRDEITVEGASMKTGLAGKGADYRRYAVSWPRQQGVDELEASSASACIRVSNMHRMPSGVCSRLSRACPQPQGHAAVWQPSC